MHWICRQICNLLQHNNEPLAGLVYPIHIGAILVFNTMHCGRGSWWWLLLFLPRPMLRRAGLMRRWQHARTCGRRKIGLHKCAGLYHAHKSCTLYITTSKLFFSTQLLLMVLSDWQICKIFIFCSFISSQPLVFGNKCFHTFLWPHILNSHNSSLFTLLALTGALYAVVLYYTKKVF